MGWGEGGGGGKDKKLWHEIYSATISSLLLQCCLRALPQDSGATLLVVLFLGHPVLAEASKAGHDAATEPAAQPPLGGPWCQHLHPPTRGVSVDDVLRLQFKAIHDSRNAGAASGKDDGGKERGLLVTGAGKDGVANKVLNRVGRAESVVHELRSHYRFAAEKNLSGFVALSSNLDRRAVRKGVCLLDEGFVRRGGRRVTERCDLVRGGGGGLGLVSSKLRGVIHSRPSVFSLWLASPWHISPSASSCRHGTSRRRRL